MGTPPQQLISTIADALGADVTTCAPLSGGCVGEVYRVETREGRTLIAKVDASGSGQLDLEGDMLAYLRDVSALPVPRVHVSRNDLLVMTYVDHDGRRRGASGDRDAARHVAALHAIEAEHYGFERDTLIGGLPQPNPQTSDWIDFFAEHRLLYMGRACVELGRTSERLLHRIEKLCKHLDRWIDTSNRRPALLHGDIWGGNVLFDAGSVAAFIDPAIYYGDPEVELAFTTLFDTFGDPFYETYDHLQGIAPGFWEVRRDLYNLYPLLVHVRLFGGSYLQSVERTLDELGV